MCVILISTLYGIELLTSPANPLLRDIRRAAARGELTEDGLWVAEGFHLLEEALRSQCAIPVVLASEEVSGRVPAKAATRHVVVPDKLFQSIAATETSQGVIALVKPPEWRIADLFRGNGLVMVLDGLQDPGNAGAIVRAAEAFGATGVMFVKGSASPFHPKTVRAAAGSLFRVPFIAGLDAALAAAALREQNVAVFAAMPRADSGIGDFSHPCAIVVGNEARGVGEDLRAMAQGVAIPTAGVESLNAAVAASILLYEARRQRA
jgi:TrmH family RNA methyltransferase